MAFAVGVVRVGPDADVAPFEFERDRAGNGEILDRLLFGHWRVDAAHEGVVGPETFAIEPGDPGIPKDAHATSFVAIGASTSRLDLPARGFKATSPFRARTLGTGSPGSNTIIVTLGISSILGIS